MNYLTCYAQFVFAYGDGLEPAIEILNRASEMVGSLDLLTRSGYYYTYAYFYEAVGDNEKAGYYRGLGGQGFDDIPNIGGNVTVEAGGEANIDSGIMEEENNEEVE